MTKKLSSLDKKEIGNLTTVLNNTFGNDSFSQEQVTAFYSVLTKEIHLLIKNNLLNIGGRLATNPSEMEVSVFFNSNYTRLLSLGETQKVIKDFIKSDNKYFGLYNISPKSILSIIEKEVQAKNKYLLFKVVNEIPEIEQEGKTFIGFEEAAAKYSDNSYKPFNLKDIIKPPLLDLLTQILENPKKISKTLLEFNKKSTPSLIVEVLENEVGKNNKILLQKLIETLDITENKEKLLDLLNEVLESQQKVGVTTYLKGMLKDLKNQQTPEIKISTKAKELEVGGGEKFTPEQVILTCLENFGQYEKLVDAVNSGIQNLKKFLVDGYFASSKEVSNLASTITKQIKEFEFYRNENELEPSEKSYEDFKENQKQELEAKKEIEKQLKAEKQKQAAEKTKQINRIKVELRNIAPAHINAEIARVSREEKIKDDVLNELRQITGKDLNAKKLQNLESIKGYTDDLARKILTSLIQQGVITLDSLKPSSIVGEKQARER